MSPQIDAPADLGSITPPENIPQVGPVEPFPRAERWATVTALPGALETESTEPVTEIGEEDITAEDCGETEAAPAHPVRPGDPESSSAASGDGQREREATESEEPASRDIRPDPVQHTPPDPEPRPPRKPKDSRWEHATSVGYWMSVSVGAAGQIFALASWMDMGWLNYPVAAAGAAFAEVTMIGASKRARNNRIAENPKPWKLLLVIASTICGYATLMNFIHWMTFSIGMAVMFAGGSAVGFTVETTVEHIDAAEYERRRKHFHDEYRKWQDRQARQSRTRPAAPQSLSASRKPAGSAKSAPAARSSSAGRAKSSAASAARTEKSALLAEIVDHAMRTGCGYRAAHSAFKDRAGCPSDSTVKRELDKARQRVSAS